MSGWQKPPTEIYNDGLVEDKVRYLEKNLDILRAEVDMKMQIMEQILSTRNEQFVMQKKLIEKEHALYQSVMNHWKNTPDLAANGHSLRYSKNTQDFEIFETTSQTLTPASIKRSSTSAAFDSQSDRTRLRAKRFRTLPTGSHIQTKREIECPESDSDEEDPGSPGSIQCNSIETEVEEPNSGAESDQDVVKYGADDVESGMEKRVFVNFYNEEPTHPEEGSSDPIWLHFLHEEGKGTGALCKKCDESGYQQIYKLTTASLAVLRRHLKRKHKIIVEAPPQAELKPPIKSDLSENNQYGPRKVNFLRHNNQLYRRNGFRNSTEYWRCREEKICSGKVVRRKDGTIHVTAEHTCLTSPADCDAMEFKEKMRELAASNPLLPPPEVIAVCKEGYSQEVLEVLPPDTALRRTIQRIRQAMESAAPPLAEWM